MTDQQVRLLRRKRMEGKTQETAAAIAGMSMRSAWKWQCGPLPSETKQERWWRTGPIPSTGSGLPALAVRQLPLELCWMLKRRWRRQFGQLWMPRRHPRRFLQAIAAELNATGTPGPNGRILSRRHIRQILRNEVYCGTNVLECFGTTRPGYRGQGAKRIPANSIPRGVQPSATDDVTSG